MAGVDLAGRPDPPVAAGERTMLEAFLDFQRATLVWKVTGVSDVDARRRLLPRSLMSLGGLVKHLIDVEAGWFRKTMAGRVRRGELVARRPRRRLAARA